MPFRITTPSQHMTKDRPVETVGISSQMFAAQLGGSMSSPLRRRVLSLGVGETLR